MKNLLKLLSVSIITAVFFLIVACGGGSGSSGGDTASDHVYISGNVGNDTNGRLAVYWKDGVINYFPLEAGYAEGYIIHQDSIEVDSSGKVYVIGVQENVSGEKIYGYWKDSEFTKITDSDAFPFCGILGITVDTTGIVWVSFLAGADNNTATCRIWKTGSTLTEFAGCTNIFRMRSDGSGNVFIAGTTGGTSVFHDDFWMSPNCDWTPTVWKNGIDATSLPFSISNSYGYVGDLTIDKSGNLYAIGVRNGSDGPAVYWKTTNGIWSTETSLAEGAYGSYVSWFGDALAVDNSGNIHAAAAISTLFPPPQDYNFFLKYSEAILVYWDGASSNPVELPRLAGYNLFLKPHTNGAVDLNGNYYIAGALATSEANANDDKGIPLYWKNGGTPVQLSLGSNDGTNNTFGRAISIVIR